MEMLLDAENVPSTAADIYLKLGLLRRDKLSDLPGALGAFVSRLHWTQRMKRFLS